MICPNDNSYIYVAVHIASDSEYVAVAAAAALRV